MKLSQKLKLARGNCGDIREAIQGYAEEAEKLEAQIEELRVELFNYAYHEAMMNGASPELAVDHANKMGESS